MPKSFISYSHINNDKRVILEKLLRKHRLSPIVVASRNKPAMLLATKVGQALEEADYLIPILTVDSISNQWVNQEIGYANKLIKDNKIRIVPLVEDITRDKLKGFIHNQMDLPFIFKNNTDNEEFKEQCQRLIQYLKTNKISEKKSIPNFSAVMSSLFWNCYYQYKWALEGSLVLKNTGNTVLTIRQIKFRLSIHYLINKKRARLTGVKKTFRYESSCYGVNRSIFLAHRPLILKPGEMKNLYNFVFIPTNTYKNDRDNPFSYKVSLSTDKQDSIPMKFISINNEIFEKDVELLHK